MRNLTFCLCLLAIAITACSPSAGIVATAMAQTQAALPTRTYTFTPERPTTLPAETHTPAPTMTSTPDVRVIRADIEDILCDDQDFPGGGRYFLPEPDVVVFTKVPETFKFSHSYHWTNDILVSADNLGKADKAVIQNYLSETGRLDGMWAEFRKGKIDFSGPNVVLCNVESFETTQGALLAVQKYNAAEISKAQGWEYFDEPSPAIGSASVFLNEKKYAEKGYTAIQFSYRNYRVTISTNKTPFKEVNSDVLYSVALKIMQKLENAPLGAP